MFSKRLQSVLIISLALTLCFHLSLSSASDNPLIQQLTQAAEGKAVISYHSATGKVRFLGASPSAPFPQPFPVQPDAPPEAAARSFLHVYGGIFGITDEAIELSTTKSKTLSDGRSVVKFHQIYNGLPVIAGEIVVNMDAQKRILAVNGETSPAIILDTDPSFSADQAQTAALGLVAKKYSVDQKNLSASPPELSVYNPVLIGEEINNNFLAWKIIVSSNSAPIREFVLIDAKNGMTLLTFNQVDTALDRSIYDNDDGYWGLPGLGPVRTEGQGPTGIADVDLAYDYLGDTYDFYLTNHNRDSIDGAGMSLIATVRFCDPYYKCPYKNAYWNGTQMVFGDGFAAADDVVGHELTHGVTERESGLFYYMQSGAINESLSDVWGEFIDLTNTGGTDTAAVRWLMGEDLPIGAIRSMKNPPTFGDPDSMLSTRYYCKGGDNGGVHRNSGVNNKAAYLMTDGGTFNGYKINGIGISKVAKIYYEVQINLLTSGSDYKDLGDALNQACQNLIGTVTTAADCAEVYKAINAVHMYSLPSCKSIDVALCNNGTATNVWFDDLENTGSGNWTHGVISGYDVWSYPQNPNPLGWDMTYTTSGHYNIYGYDYYYISDSYIQMNPTVAIPANAFMAFNHSYDFEGGGSYYFDGGVLEYSANGGPWTDAESLIVVNGYQNKIYFRFGNPLGGRRGFTGSSHGYTASKLDLSSLAGQNVRFRFRIGTDSSYDWWGWFIDDVRIYTCSNPDPSIMTVIYPNGGETLQTGDLVDITWSGPTNMAYATLKYSPNNGLTWKNIEKNISGTTSFRWMVPLQADNKRKSLIKIVGFDSNNVRIGSDKSDTTFTIEVVNLTAPNGGETWTWGSTQNITWTTNTTKAPVASVKLFYTKNGGTTWNPITTIPGNPGTYSWTLPAGTTTKTKCKVKLVLKDAAGNKVGSDLSDSTFTIQP